MFTIRSARQVAIDRSLEALERRLEALERERATFDASRNHLTGLLTAMEARIRAMLHRSKPTEQPAETNGHLDRALLARKGM